MALDDDSFREARGRLLEAKLKLGLFAGSEYYAVRSPRLQGKVRLLLADPTATERDWELVVREVEDLMLSDQTSPVRPTLPAPADHLTDAERSLAAVLADKLNGNTERISRRTLERLCTSVGIESHAGTLAKFRRLGIVEETACPPTRPGFLKGRDPRDWLVLRLTGLIPFIESPGGRTPDRPGNETGSTGNRPAWGRDHLFLKWRRDGLKPAAIRERWNALSDSERKTICPECWDHIEGTSGSTRDLIKKAISKAEGEL